MNSADIKRLRSKFIWTTSVALGIAMGIVAIAITVSTTALSRSVIKRSLNAILDAQGQVDEMDFSSQEDYRGFNINNVFASLIEVQDRFFLVEETEDGELTVVASAESANASMLTYAETAIGRNANFGRIYNYFYKTRETEDGILIAFLECSSEIRLIGRMTVIAATVSIAAFAVTIFLVRKLSWRMIQPEIENSKRQEEFITNASHELKTPLAVIRANTELTQTLYGEDEWSDSTLKQVDRMSSMIQNLVMITRDAEKEDGKERTLIDLSPVVEESAKTYEVLAQQDGLTLETEIRPETLLRAESSEIRQLTTLLIDNAIKYCDAGGTIRVVLEPIRRGKGAMLSVSNNYADGANVDYKRFFDRFYREEKAHTVSEKSGYGIGLSIAESLCQQYHGTIQASWKDGVITFTCKLY